MKLLEKKTAIVTGASSGIGRASAKLFAHHGARIVVSARRGDLLDTLVDEIAAGGGNALAVPGDVTNPEVNAHVVEAAIREFGGLDIAFNNAGTLGEMGPATDISLKGWQRTLDVNLTAAFVAAQAQLPELLKAKGSLIFTSSFVGPVLGFPSMAAYAAAKAALVGLVKVLAVETAEKGVRVNALLPGGVDTPMGAEGAGSPENMDFIRGLHAMKRIGTPDEIAQAALYLASDMSSFQTGSSMQVDGGVTVTKV